MIFDYPGAGHTPAHYDLLSLAVPQEHRQDEAVTMATRWWDYRALHPADATYLYAELYRRSCIDWARRFNDADTAGEVRAFTPDDVFKSRDLTTMWLSRQLADRLGCPYEFSLGVASSRAFNRGFLSMPRPNQLYSEDFELDLKAAWDAGQALVMRTATNDALKADAAHKGRQWHLYRDWLTERVLARPAPRYRLLARLLNERQLSEQDVLDRFGQDELARAAEYRQLIA